MKPTLKELVAYFESSTHAQKQAFEQRYQDDDMVMDAIAAFHEHPEALKRIKKKALRSQYMTRVSVLALLCSLLIGYLFIPNHPETKNASAKTTPVDKIRIHHKSDVDHFQELAKHKTLKATQLSADFQHQLNQSETVTNRPFASEELDRMHVNSIETISHEKRSIAHFIARELFIKQLKVIDYRYYRKRNQDENQGNMNVMPNESEEQLQLSYMNVLSEAMEDFAAGDYKLALLTYDEILADYPEDANALFYGALSLYNLGQFEQSKIRLVKLNANRFQNFTDEANWYLLLNLKALKDPGAEKLQQRISEENGFYSERAKKL
ncbi:MAG: hypothetical protein RLZZ301_1797 [Bacteroidota bacterium]|jgi:hypothetical protein